MMSMMPGSVANLCNNFSASNGGGSEYLNSALIELNLHSPSCLVPHAEAPAARARRRRLISSRSSSAKPFTSGSAREDWTNSTSRAEFAISINLAPSTKRALLTVTSSWSGRNIFPRKMSLQYSRGKSRASWTKSKMVATASSGCTGTRYAVPRYCSDTKKTPPSSLSTAAPAASGAAGAGRAVCSGSAISRRARCCRLAGGHVAVRQSSERP
mmetsp:Transcript_8590/g.25590  ORF Transcript_8590/g.25590 Transcript_8590/m.25590 type:complete len:213 (+) Transcript_8590:628-1266(+)